MNKNRSEIHQLMLSRAEAMRQPGETAEAAMARYIATPEGAHAARAYQDAEPAPIEQRPGATTGARKLNDEPQARAFQAIQVAAVQYRDAHPELTHEQAIVAVLAENPKLYAEYARPATLTLGEVSERMRKLAEDLTGKRYGIEIRDASGDRVA